MINISDLNVNIGNKNILKDINLIVDDNDIICIFGPSGSGKTTLLKSLSGIIMYDGKVEPKILNPSYIFQEPRLVKSMTVIENLKLINDDISQINDLISDFELDDCANTYCNKLSGGEAQRVNICRALLNDYDILFVDEALNSLDIGLKHRVIEKMMKYISAKNKPTILVSHDIYDGINLANHFVIINDGIILNDFKKDNLTKEELYNKIFDILKQI